MRNARYFCNALILVVTVLCFEFGGALSTP
nr:DUF3265 domain-containing protein [Vibrio anguillarum]